MYLKIFIVLVFVLLLFLMLVSYFVGTTNSIAALSGAGKRLVYWGTGRDQNGNFVQ